VFQHAPQFRGYGSAGQPFGGLATRLSRSRVLAGVAALVVGFSLFGAATPALAAGVVDHSIDVAYAGTGYGTADQCAIAEDTSATDLVACTNDSIGYLWNYNVTGSADPTVATFSQTIPAGYTFEASNVTVCQGSPTTFSGTGTITTNPDGSQTLECVLTFPAGGSLSGNLPITVKATGAVSNGTLFQPGLTVTQPDLPSSTELPAAVKIISEPVVDLAKGMGLIAQGEDVYDGRDGYIVMVAQVLRQDPSRGVKGIEALATPVAWTDDLSGMPANAELVFGSWGGYSTAAASPSNCFSGTYYGFPFSYNALGSELTCSQSAPGAPIDLTIVSANLSGSSTAENNQFWVPGTIYSTGFTLFIPRESVPVGAQGASFFNQLTGFDPDSISGESDYGDGFEPGGAPGDTCTSPLNNNNCAGVQLFNNAGSGPPVGGKSISGLDQCIRVTAPGVDGNNTGQTVPEWCNGLPPTGGTSGIPAQATVGQQLVDVLYVTTPPGFDNTMNLTFCDKWDPTEQQLDTSRIVAYRDQSHVGNAYDQTHIQVQYTTADYSDLTVRGDAGCGLPGDDALDGPWFDSVAAAGGAAAVSGVRVINTDPVGVTPGAAVWVYVPLTNVSAESAIPKVDQFALRYDGAPTTATNPSGTIPIGAASYVVVRTRTGLTKDTVPTMTTAGAGNTVAYHLQPTISSGASTPDAEVITVVDTLSTCAVNPQLAGTTSADWTMAVTPADVGPDGVACTADDVSGAVLTFTSNAPVVPNSTVAPIDYTILVSANTPDNTSLVNTAVVSSPGSIDIDEVNRTATKTIVVRAAAQISITKAVDQPVVEITPDAVGWTVTVTNTSTLQAGSTEWIDVLPWNGDGRGTDLTGALNITGVTPLNAELTELEYTSANPGSINEDPTDGSNGVGGSTTWCLESAFGTAGCPASFSAVTGVRFTVGDFGPGDVTGIHISASPQGNVEDDVYVNQVGPGDAENLGQPLPESNPAQVQVVASSIGDRVWLDGNSDGVQDAGEAGIVGVTVELLDSTGMVIATAVTGADGIYTFAGYHSGTYATRVVASTVPVELGATYDLQHGTTGPDGNSGPIDLGINTDFVDADFGYNVVPASIEVEKVVDGGAAEYATGPYTIVVTCSLRGTVLDGFPKTLTFAGAETQTIETVKGAECSATETVTGGATTVTYLPATPVTATPTGDPVRIVVTNTFEAGSLVINKALEGAGAGSLGDGPFTFHVTCSFDGDDNVFETDVTLERVGDETSLTSDPITGLPVGAECVVTETDNGGADETPAPVTVTIVANEQANTVFAGFVNEFSAGSLELTKVLDGEGAESEPATSTTFTVLVTCQLETVDETDAPIIVDLYSGEVSIRGGETKQLVDADGEPLLLPLGTHCFGEETDWGTAVDHSIDFDSFENAVVVEEGTPADLQELTLTATNTFEKPVIPVPPVTPTEPVTPWGSLPNTGFAAGSAIVLGSLSLLGGVLVLMLIAVKRRRQA
jgi:hypothetical protein